MKKSDTLPTARLSQVFEELRARAKKADAMGRTPLAGLVFLSVVEGA